MKETYDIINNIFFEIYVNKSSLDLDVAYCKDLLYLEDEYVIDEILIVLTIHKNILYYAKVNGIDIRNILSYDTLGMYKQLLNTECNDEYIFKK